MERKKIVLIGAGSAVFTKGLVADFIGADFGSWEIALCDINPEILAAVAKLAKKMAEQKGADIKITAGTERKELLPGADFVVVTIAVGGRRAWEQDVLIPRRYGIYQPVGDSVMPGGISRAQRMIPAMLDIARDVTALCPKAWFFNYSNPMTAIVTAVRKATGANLVGLCHGVIHGEKYLARMMGVEAKRVSAIAAGLNHLTFFCDIRVDGAPARERLLDIVARQRAEAKKNGHECNFLNSPLKDAEIPNFMDNPLSWELYERLGGLPAVVDRHAVEFFPERFPGGHFHGRRLGIDAFPIEEVIARGEAAYRDMLSQGDGEGEVEAALFRRSEDEHEQLAEIIRSLLYDERRIFSVNIPNAGAVKGLPEDAVLEIPGVATALGFCPMAVPGFTAAMRAIVMKRLAPVDVAVEAALTGSRVLWEEALMLDGAVTDYQTAKAIVDDCLAEFGAYLPQYR